jgi:hypothetical protein
MAKEIKTEIRIQASAAKVWAVLSDYEAYSQWNPFIRSIQGKVATGERIQVHITPPDAKGMHFTPKVLCYEHNKEFKWLGHFLIPGIFDGEHRFEIIDHGDGSSTLVHSEKFRGILVPFLSKLLNDNTLRGFKAMNEALKVRVEGGMV